MGGLFQFLGVRLLSLALPETCGFSLALLSEQGRFHRIEGLKETFLPCSSFLAGEAHREEGEAVAGDLVHGKLASRTVGVFTDSKIAVSEILRAFQIFNRLQNIKMVLLERLSDDEGRGCGNTVFGLDHVFNGGLEDFLIGGLFYFHPTFLFEIIRLAYRFLLWVRGSSSVF